MRNKETPEETAENFWLNDNTMADKDRVSYVNGFLTCAKWQQERMYSEEEVEDIIYKVCGTVARWQGITLNGNNIKAAFEKFKKK